MKDAKAALTPTEQAIFNFIDGQRAEFRLYPDIYVRELVEHLRDHEIIIDPGAVWAEGFDSGELDVWRHEEHGYDTPCIRNPYLPPLPVVETNPYDLLCESWLFWSEWIDVRFEQASNRVKYGVADPAGGNGRTVPRKPRQP